jgi:co-chaperonin GroES (HSP10)
MILQPQGKKIIVLPLEKENYVSDGGIEIVGNLLKRGRVVEVCNQYFDVYKKGDVVIFPERAGTELMYNGTVHLYLTGEGAPNGDIWAIEIPDSEDKQNGL